MPAFVFFIVLFHLAIMLTRGRSALFDTVDTLIICWGCYLLLS